MAGNSNSGRKKEPKTSAAPYKATSLSGKQFSSLITNKPLNMPEVKTDPLEQSQAEVKKAVNDRIESWAIIKKAEISGMPKELIDEMKIQMNLTKDEVKTDQVMTQSDVMIMNMINESDDPEMKKIYLMSLMNKGKNSMDPMMMAMVMGNGNKKKESESFMEKLALKFIEGKTDSKSDIDKGMEFFEKMNRMQDNMKGADVLDEMLKQKTKLVELGIVQDPTGGDSIEDKKIDLEFKKLELNHELLVSEQESKSGGQEEIMKAATAGISALLGAIGHFASGKKNEDTGPSQEERIKEQIQNGGGSKIMADCSNPKCGTQFPIVTDKDRLISCPNGKCDFTYVIKNKEFFLSEESQKKLDTFSSNEQEGTTKLE